MNYSKDCERDLANRSDSALHCLPPALIFRGFLPDFLDNFITPLPNDRFAGIVVYLAGTPSKLGICAGPFVSLLSDASQWNHGLLPD